MARNKYSPTFGGQFRALSYKQLTVFRRSGACFFCQMLTPALIIILLWLLQLQLQSTERSAGEPPNVDEDGNVIAPDTLLNNRAYDWNLDDDVTVDAMCGTRPLGSCGIWEWYVMSSDDPDIGTASDDGDKSGFLVNLRQRELPYDPVHTKGITKPVVSVPFVEPHGSFDESVQRFQELLVEREQRAANCTEEPDFFQQLFGINPCAELITFDADYLPPTGGLHFRKIDPIANVYNFDIVTGGSTGIGSDTTGSGGNIHTPKRGLDFAINVNNLLGFERVRECASQECLVTHAMDLVFSAAHRNLTGASTEFRWDSQQMAIPLNPYDPGETPVDSLMVALTFITLPLVLTLQMPVFVNEIVVERSEGLRDMMRIMGLREGTYWLLQYLWNITLYTSIMFVTFLLGIFFGIASFKGPLMLLLIPWLLWGPALISFSYALSVVFKKPRTATYVTSFLTLALHIFISLYMWQSVGVLPRSPFLVMLFPHWAFYRATYMYWAYQVPPRLPYTLATMPADASFAIFMLAFDAVAWFLLARYLDAVWPHSRGVPKHPAFPLLWLISKVRGRTSAAINGGDVDFNSSLMDTGAMLEDESVKRERQTVSSVQDSAWPAGTHLVIKQLSKTYAGSNGRAPKKALTDFSLAMRPNECLCLLGPNGAGKTTLMSILFGLQPPTSGNALVAGADLRADLDGVLRNIGVAQQFDVLFSQLTVDETLLFYTRLKGVPSKQELAHVAERLNEVALVGDRFKLTSSLSGGMRRRLSVGIALIGNPDLVFLDEPTTGLDPVSKRQMWDILTATKQDHSIVLSTHAMEEAETLSDRIGIMAKGRLVTIGTPQELKSRYGSGYVITMTIAPSRETAANKFIAAQIPKAKLLTSFGGHRTYQIAANEIQMSSFFKTMEQQKQRHGIVEWGITQSGIEDVFLNVIDEELLDTGEVRTAA